MKLQIFASLLLTVVITHGQGFLIVDQQSTNTMEGGIPIQGTQPLGQTFVPSVSSIGYVALNLYVIDFFRSNGVSVFVNLWSGSISNSTLLGSTTPVYLPHRFGDITNFFFPTSITLTPGATYALQPIAQPDGENVGSLITDASYPFGTEIYQGVLLNDRNLWFQEGIIAVPEPSAMALLVLGGGCLLRLKKRKNRDEN